MGMQVMNSYSGSIRHYKEPWEISMNELENALDRLTGILERLHAPILEMLQPGLSQKEIDILIEDFSFKLTHEVHSFYKWRNGLNKNRPVDYEFLPDGYLLSLDEALDSYKITIDIAGQISKYANIEPSQLWDPRWFPILSNMSGDFHVVLCNTKEVSQSPVYYVYNEDRGSTYLAYDSLTGMILTVAKCYETGSYSINERGKIQEDRQKVAQIVREFNPRRIQELTKDI